jgi:hypothetical protein
LGPSGIRYHCQVALEPAIDADRAILCVVRIHSRNELLLDYLGDASVFGI